MLNYSMVCIVINRGSWSNIPAIKKGFIYYLSTISQSFYNKRQRSHLDSTIVVKIIVLRT
jgi:hypothetical protein